MYLRIFAVLSFLALFTSQAAIAQGVNSPNATDYTEIRKQAYEFMDQIQALMKQVNEKTLSPEVARTQAEALAQRLIPPLQRTILESVSTGDYGRPDTQILIEKLNGYLNGTPPISDTRTEPVEWLNSLSQYRLANINTEAAPAHYNYIAIYNPEFVPVPLTPITPSQQFTVSQAYPVTVSQTNPASPSYSDLLTRAQAFSSQLQAIREKIAYKVNLGSATSWPDQLDVFYHGRNAASDLANSVLPSLTQDIMASIRGGGTTFQKGQELVDWINSFLDDRVFQTTKPRAQGNPLPGVVQTEIIFSMKQYQITLTSDYCRFGVMAF